MTLGFSPCPNDTFIFEALVNGKIDTGDIEFEPVLEDVQTLNQWALQGKLDITKLSFGVLPLVLNHYALLSSGGALGKGVGPILISSKELPGSEVEEQCIAIPGENTTAHLLFNLKYPHAKNKIFMRYDKIESFVGEGKGLGVIIHENRFTYEDKGLKKIIDLGEYWEEETNIAIPLGGIVIKKNKDKSLQQKVNKLIEESIRFAFANYPELNDYIRQHSQEMSEDVMRKHIDLYVNDYSINLGPGGRNAVMKLLHVKDAAISASEVFV